MYMVMQTVSLADTVSLEEAPSGFTLESGGFVPAGTVTLEERAARAFFDAIGRPMPGLRAVLDKVVPSYAGLGGGSADVAALLRLLRTAYRPDLSTAGLERIGFQIGSDMPFCVRGGTCLAEGRGERLTDLPPLPPCWIVLCKPGDGIPTPALFARADTIPIVRRPDTAGVIEALTRGDLAGAAVRAENVFEQVLPEGRRDILEVKDRLRSLGALGASMSGSGPAVFGIFREEDPARAAAEDLRARWPETFLARPVGDLDGQDPDPGPGPD